MRAIKIDVSIARLLAASAMRAAVTQFPRAKARALSRRLTDYFKLEALEPGRRITRTGRARQVVAASSKNSPQPIRFAPRCKNAGRSQQLNVRRSSRAGRNAACALGALRPRHDDFDARSCRRIAMTFRASQRRRAVSCRHYEP